MDITEAEPSNVSSSPSIGAGGAAPPPLPPRVYLDPPPGYSLEDEGLQNLNVSVQWHSNDPRSSSTQSLVPIEADRNGRRTLLLIYIHGFMGNDTSFQSFPAHIHNLMSITLAETHAVHTKIYPRYKSRKAIEFARDDFSKWLQPHEDSTTDVILLGHSLGGILVSEVALLTPICQVPSQALCHRILGTICFDTPFLGMHPGVVISGIGSLFRPTPETPATSSSTHASGSRVATPSLGEHNSSSPSSNNSHQETTSQVSDDQLSPSPSNISLLSASPSNDPNYNPPFPNDVKIAERKGWSNMLHFVNKHSEGLTSATKQYFLSHLEFGGCLADYPGLKARYSKIRRLEDVDEITSREEQRVRFVNYYTASTGLPKKLKEAEANVPNEPCSPTPLEGIIDDMSLGDESVLSISNDASVLEVTDGNILHMVDSDINNDQSAPMQHIECVPVNNESNGQVEAETETMDPELRLSSDVQEDTPSTTLPTHPKAQLPPLPSVPVEPKPIDLSVYNDKDSRKVAEREQKRMTRAYQQTVKDHESAVKDRQKLLEKWEKKSRQEQEKKDKSLQKQREKEEKEEQRRKEKEKTKPDPDPTKPVKTKPEKVKRDKKFCLLPSDLSGKQDVCWIRVYMEGVDEVGAHTGLFVPDEKHYEGLVGEVGNRIEDWVKEDATRRMILELEREL